MKDKFENLAFSIRAAFQYEARVGFVKIKKLMERASIITTMCYMYASGEGEEGDDKIIHFKRHCAAEYCHSIGTNEKRQIA